MDTVSSLLIAALAISVCYYVPKEFNQFFLKKYDCEASSWQVATIPVAVFILGALVDMNIEGPFWVFTAIAVLLLLATLFLCGYKAKKAGASALEIAVAVLMQIFSTVSVVVSILLVICTLYSFGKRRRRK